MIIGWNIQTPGAYGRDILFCQYRSCNINTSPPEGMLFDIGYADGIIPVLAQPEKPVLNGTRVE